MMRFELNRRLGYPKIKLRWLAELAARKILDRYRRSYLCESTGTGLINPLEATFRHLELRGLYPDPLIALELFGGYGLRKTVDIALRCAHITHIDIHESLIHHARMTLPGDRTVFVCADSIQAVRSRVLPRTDYNFIHIDNDCGWFGDYCENFDLFPAVFECLGDRGSLVFNVQLDVRAESPDAEWLLRRRTFFGLGDSGDATCVSYEVAKRAYLSRIPAGRFSILDVFPVPHHRQTIYLVISLARQATGSAA